MCVNNPPCGADVAGNCPVLDNGQLTCSWVEDSTCVENGGNAKCKAFDGRFGIFKCLTVDVCNSLYGANSCSKQCSASNGLSCNGRGTCESTGAATFQCRCNDGWGGERCEEVLSNECTVGVGDCGRNGECVNGTCVCSNGFSGKQCEIAGKSSDITPSPSLDPNTETKVTPTPNPSEGQDSITATSSSIDSGLLAAIISAVSVIAIVAILVIVKKSRSNREQENTNAFANEFEEGGSTTGLASIDDDNFRETTGPLTPKDTITIF